MNKEFAELNIKTKSSNKKIVKKNETQNNKIEKKKNAYSIVVGTFKYRNNAEKQIKLIKSKYQVSTKDKI